MPPTPSPEQTREQLIDELLGLLQPASAEPLTREDGREALDDLTFLGTWLLESRRKMPVLPPRPAVRADPSAPPRSEPEPDPAPKPRPRRRATRRE